MLDEHPQNAEALTYSGWLLYLASAGASDELRAAAVSDGAATSWTGPSPPTPQYPDPHCFLAIVAADADDDDATARTSGTQCLP